MTTHQGPIDESQRRLRLAPDVELRLRGGLVEITLGERRHVAEMRVLGILELFAHPISLREVFDRLGAVGTEELIQGKRLVRRLRDKRVLIDADGNSPRFASGFGAPWAHVAMLDDVTRTRAFVRAIHATVRPGDVVLDVGTGTGVLAVEAARAGARRVYAVEQRGIGEGARDVFGANGLADRIQVVQGQSTSVELPERADVLVSEILGNDPFAEGILSTFRDARERHLKPQAQLVPCEVSLFALPVDLPDEYLDAHTFSETNVARWREDFLIDFGPLTTFGVQVTNLPNVKPQAARDWTTIGDPVELARIDLARVDRVRPHAVPFVAHASARCLGLLLYFEAVLAPGVLLSTAPSAAAADNHWTCCVHRAAERPTVSAGDVVCIEFSAAKGSTVLRVR
jgi:protein arginine N-methyltransferase 1